jgi:hypothetical protein
VRFYVGQRVKIVECDNALMEAYVGTEHVIVAASGQWPGSWILSGAQTTSSGRRCSWNESTLVPVEDRNEKVSWSECKWQPEHLRSKA